MAYFLFVDESGKDRRASPYEVLAGIAVHDSVLWSFVQAVQAAETDAFGDRVTLGRRELKGKRLLNRRTFRMAEQHSAIPTPRRAELASEILADGTSATVARLAALAQAKIDFCGAVLDVCRESQIFAFASIVDPNAERPSPDVLRKDYAFLFERFFYFLEDRGSEERGVVVFDEIDTAGTHRLVDQMSEYFQHTRTGRQRSARVIPEPFFVHSELTTGIQVADLVAYIVSWGVRFGSLNAPARPELRDLASKVMAIRYRAERQTPDDERFFVWSFKEIFDLRPTADPGFRL
jgi:hypothetical protein